MLGLALLEPPWHRDAAFYLLDSSIDFHTTTDLRRQLFQKTADFKR
jgi:hypothetical protein